MGAPLPILESNPALMLLAMFAMWPMFLTGSSVAPLYKVGAMLALILDIYFASRLAGKDTVKLIALAATFMFLPPLLLLPALQRKSQTRDQGTEIII